MKMINICSSLIIGCLICTTVIAQENKNVVTTDADDRGYIVSVGQEAPDFIIEYLDGTTIPLSNLRGKVVMLQFTASWCSVCRLEMPFIERDIRQKHKDNPDFVLIGIDLKESAEVTDIFTKEMKISYPITLDTDGSRFALFCDPKAGVTRNIIIDKSGKMAMLTRLFEENEFNEMVTLINTLLK